MLTRLNIKVIPNANRPGIAGWLGDVLKIKVSAPAEKGKANRAVEEILGRALGLPSHSVRIIGGHTKPRKTIEIDGLSPREIRERLSPTE